MLSVKNLVMGYVGIIDRIEVISGTTNLVVSSYDLIAPYFDEHNIFDLIPETCEHFFFETVENAYSEETTTTLQIYA